MSTQLKESSRVESRLNVTAIFEHQTIQFEGNVFEFLEHLLREKWTGRGTFMLNQGSVMDMEFDLRSKKPIDNSQT